MAKKKEQYTALTGLTNDKKKTSFVKGDLLKEGDFTKKQFKDFLAINAIEEVKEAD